MFSQVEAFGRQEVSLHQRPVDIAPARVQTGDKRAGEDLDEYERRENACPGHQARDALTTGGEGCDFVFHDAQGVPDEKTEDCKGKAQMGGEAVRRDIQPSG